MPKVKTMYRYTLPGSNAARRHETAIKEIQVKTGRLYLTNAGGYNERYDKDPQIDVNGNAVYDEITTYDRCYALYETKEDAELRSSRDQILAVLHKIDFRAVLSAMSYDALVDFSKSMRRWAEDLDFVNKPNYHPQTLQSLAQVFHADEERRYRLLDRMRQDCEYYLGGGNRCPKHLWAKKETDQIMYMKELWRSFPEDKKPEWLSWENILHYEKEMCPQPMLAELYALTLREQDGEVLSDDEKDRYLILYHWLCRLDVEIPFGVEI